MNSSSDETEETLSCFQRWEISLHAYQETPVRLGSKAWLVLVLVCKRDPTPRPWRRSLTPLRLSTQHMRRAPPLNLRWEKGRSTGCFQHHVVLTAPPSSFTLKPRAIPFSPISTSKCLPPEQINTRNLVKFRKKSRPAAAPHPPGGYARYISQILTHLVSYF